jgi:hypothetical protein
MCIRLPLYLSLWNAALLVHTLIIKLTRRYEGEGEIEGLEGEGLEKGIELIGEVGFEGISLCFSQP